MRLVVFGIKGAQIPKSAFEIDLRSTHVCTDGSRECGEGDLKRPGALIGIGARSYELPSLYRTNRSYARCIDKTLAGGRVAKSANACITTRRFFRASPRL